MFDTTQEHSERRLSPSAYIAELALPETDSLGLGEDLCRDLLDTEAHERFSRARELLDSAQTIVLNTSQAMIGDSIRWLPHAFSVARALPARNVTVTVPEKIFEMSTYMDLPENVALLNIGRDKVSLPELEQSIIIPYLQFKQEPLDILSDVTRRYGPDGILIPHRQRVAPNLDGFDVSQLDVSKPVNSVNTGDVKSVLQARLLGIDVRMRDFSQSILKPGELGNVGQFDFDACIMPDAFSYTFYDPAINCERSEKSLSVEQWRAIADQTPQRMRVALVRGVSNAEYCDMVLDAFRRHPNVHSIKVPRFRDLIPTMHASRRLITMDSATAHLANHIVLAANVEDHPMSIRTLHNGLTFRFTSFGVRGLEPGQAKTLVYQPEPYAPRRSSTNKSPRKMDTLSPDLLADFFYS